MAWRFGLAGQKQKARPFLSISCRILAASILAVAITRVPIGWTKEATARAVARSHPRARYFSEGNFHFVQVSLSPNSLRRFNSLTTVIAPACTYQQLAAFMLPFVLSRRWKVLLPGVGLAITAPLVLNLTRFRVMFWLIDRGASFIQAHDLPNYGFFAVGVVMSLGYYFWLVKPAPIPRD